MAQFYAESWEDITMYLDTEGIGLPKVVQQQLKNAKDRVLSDVLVPIDRIFETVYEKWKTANDRLHEDKFTKRICCNFCARCIEFASTCLDDETIRGCDVAQRFCYRLIGDYYRRLCQVDSDNSLDYRERAKSAYNQASREGTVENGNEGTRPEQITLPSQLPELLETTTDKEFAEKLKMLLKGELKGNSSKEDSDAGEFFVQLSHVLGPTSAEFCCMLLSEVVQNFASDEERGKLSQALAKISHEVFLHKLSEVRASFQPRLKDMLLRSETLKKFRSDLPQKLSEALETRSNEKISRLISEILKTSSDKMSQKLSESWAGMTSEELREKFLGPFKGKLREALSAFLFTLSDGDLRQNLAVALGCVVVVRKISETLRTSSHGISQKLSESWERMKSEEHREKFVRFCPVELHEELYGFLPTLSYDDLGVGLGDIFDDITVKISKVLEPASQEACQEVSDFVSRMFDEKLAAALRGNCDDASGKEPSTETPSQEMREKLSEFWTKMKRDENDEDRKKIFGDFLSQSSEFLSKLSNEDLHKNLAVVLGGNLDDMFRHKTSEILGNYPYEISQKLFERLSEVPDGNFMKEVAGLFADLPRTLSKEERDAVRDDLSKDLMGFPSVVRQGLSKILVDTSDELFRELMSEALIGFPSEVRQVLSKILGGMPDEVFREPISKALEPIASESPPQSSNTGVLGDSIRLMGPENCPELMNELIRKSTEHCDILASYSLATDSAFPDELPWEWPDGGVQGTLTDFLWKWPDGEAQEKLSEAFETSVEDTESEWLMDDDKKTEHLQKALGTTVFQLPRVTTDLSTAKRQDCGNLPELALDAVREKYAILFAARVLNKLRKVARENPEVKEMSTILADTQKAKKLKMNIQTATKRVLSLFSDTQVKQFEETLQKTIPKGTYENCWPELAKEEPSKEDVWGMDYSCLQSPDELKDVLKRIVKKTGGLKCDDFRAVLTRHVKPQFGLLH